MMESNEQKTGRGSTASEVDTIVFVIMTVRESNDLDIVIVSRWRKTN